MKAVRIALILLFVFSATGALAGTPETPKVERVKPLNVDPFIRITGAVFDSTIYRTGVNGDNWCMTWSDDGHIYTSCDDGSGWKPREEVRYNNRVWRITGGPEKIDAEFLPGFPDYLMPDEWYGYGIVSVDGILYNFITCANANRFRQPFNGVKLIYSPDHGNTWFRHDGQGASIDPKDKSQEGMFFWQEGKEYAFSEIAFLQYGQDNTLTKDNYVYLYSPNGQLDKRHLNLARVPKDQIRNRDAYEYFINLDADQNPVWTRDIQKRGWIHEFPEGYGWYSWLPSVVYNAPLDLYIMVGGGTGKDGSGMHQLPASLGLYYAEFPWGPWKQFFYTEDWVADNPDNRLYQPKLSPKWISDDGREMYLIFSDASDHWGYQYKWNQQRITLILE
jgi:Domain of unknown function (DUF4185)